VTAALPVCPDCPSVGGRCAVCPRTGEPPTGPAAGVGGDDRDRIADALTDAGVIGNSRLVDALMPVVWSIAAAHLRAAATYWDRPTVRTVAADLRRRADELDPQ
jgi:hypothetical protein